MEGSVGLFLIVSFLCGLIVAAVVASVFGITAYFRERSLKKKELRLRDDIKALVEARGKIAAGNRTEGVLQLKSIVRKSRVPDLVRLDLARALLDQDESTEAIKVLEPLRTRPSLNIEAVLLTVKAYNQLDNLTSALDELNILVSKYPSREILDQALTLSIASNRIDEALGFVKAIEDRFGGDAELQNTKAHLELQKIDRDLSPGTNAHEEALRLLQKRHKTNTHLALRVADMEEAAGRIEVAAEILTKAAVKNSDFVLWERATQLWQKHNNPERALAVLQYGRRELPKNSTSALAFQEFSVSVLLQMGLREEANTLCQQLPETPATRLLRAQVMLAREEVGEAQKLLSNGDGMRAV